MEGHIGDQRSKAVMRYLDRLKKSVRRGASLSLANAPKLHLGILEGLNHAIEVRGQDGAVYVSDLAEIFNVGRKGMKDFVLGQSLNRRSRMAWPSARPIPMTAAALWCASPQKGRNPA